jgi:hypothetical protein
VQGSQAMDLILSEEPSLEDHIGGPSMEDQIVPLEVPLV